MDSTTILARQTCFRGAFRSARGASSAIDRRRTDLEIPLGVPQVRMRRFEGHPIQHSSVYRSARYRRADTVGRDSCLWRAAVGGRRVGTAYRAMRERLELLDRFGSARRGRRNRLAARQRSL